MRDEAFARCANHRVVEFVLRIVQLRLQIIGSSDDRIQFTLGTKIAFDQLGDSKAIAFRRYQLSLEGFDPVFKRGGIYSKQHVALFQWLVGLYRNLDDLATDNPNHWHRDEI
ncbi:hypothetical protein D3C76_1374900 [compost metagenome]